MGRPRNQNGGWEPEKPTSGLEGYDFQPYPLPPPGKGEGLEIIECQWLMNESVMPMGWNRRKTYTSGLRDLLGWWPHQDPERMACLEKRQGSVVHPQPLPHTLVYMFPHFGCF